MGQIQHLPLLLSWSPSVTNVWLPYGLLLDMLAGILSVDTHDPFTQLSELLTGIKTRFMTSLKINSVKNVL